MRDSLSITMTDPLRRASVRPRLDALAGSTGFAATQIAGRALLLGLRAIEEDWRLLFPASDPTSPAAPSTPAHRPAEPEHAPTRDAVPCTAPHDTDTQHTAAPSTPAPAPALRLDVQTDPAPTVNARPDSEPPADAPRDTAPQPDASAEAAPPATEQIGRASTRDVVQALGYRSDAAFRQHCTRHPELLACSIKSGRERLWDLDRLRAEYSRLGFAPKTQPLDEQQADQLGPAEAPTT